MLRKSKCELERGQKQKPGGERGREKQSKRVKRIPRKPNKYRKLANNYNDLNIENFNFRLGAYLA